MRTMGYTKDMRELVDAAQKVVLAQVHAKNTTRREVSEEEVRADVRKINPDISSMDSRG